MRTLRHNVCGGDLLKALEAAVRAIEDVELLIGPSGAPDIVIAGKPTSKPPAGDRRAIYTLKSMRRSLDGITRARDNLYARMQRQSAEPHKARYLYCEACVHRFVADCPRTWARTSRQTPSCVRAEREWRGKGGGE